MQAVASHEYGHSLTVNVGKAMGISDIDKAADAIVKEARKGTKFKTDKQFRSNISGYAAESNCESVAEAISDVYCNGRKAKKESKAIVKVVDKYLLKNKNK